MVKYVHFICFFCIGFSENYIPQKIASGSHVTKMFFGFITVPLYIYSMLSLMSILEKNTIRFTPDSTPDDLRLDDTFCFSKEQGNVE